VGSPEMLIGDEYVEIYGNDLHMIQLIEKQWRKYRHKQREDYEQEINLSGSAL
jgi:hypothetical protein